MIEAAGGVFMSHINEVILPFCYLFHDLIFYLND